MKYAGIDEATPELAQDAARHGMRDGRGWLAELNSRVAVGAALAAAVVGIVMWLARAGQPRRDRTRAGGQLNIVRCPEHGIAYDAELEECTECAKAGTPARARHLSSVPSVPGPRPLPKSVE